MSGDDDGDNAVAEGSKSFLVHRLPSHLLGAGRPEQRLTRILKRFCSGEIKLLRTASLGNNNVSCWHIGVIQAV
jgi:hypothetical protein